MGTRCPKQVKVMIICWIMKMILLILGKASSSKDWLTWCDGTLAYARISCLPGCMITVLFAPPQEIWWFIGSYGTLSLPCPLWGWGWSHVCIVPSLRKGETIAVMQPEKSCYQCHNVLRKNWLCCGFVLGNKNGFLSMGFATFLLSLLQEVVRWREKTSPISVYLKANEKGNQTAWAWYKKVDFFQRGRNNHFCPIWWHRSHLRVMKISSSILEGQKNWHGSTKSEGRWFPPVQRRFFHQRFFTKPDSFDKISYFTNLPGEMSLKQLDDCGWQYCPTKIEAKITCLYFDV